MRISAVLVRLQDTTAQIRVRGAVLLLISFVAIAGRFGLETILGAFLAGVVLGMVDPCRAGRTSTWTPCSPARPPSSPLVAAGLLSVLIFPLVVLGLIGGHNRDRDAAVRTEAEQM
jgi:hypothetical protein